MHLYILKNESMPNMYKIGISADPVLRAGVLSSSTGVPLPFEVLHTVDCVTERQARRAEAMAHAILDYDRINTGREFFRLSHENIGIQAIVVAAFIAWRPDRSKEQWQDLTDLLTQWPVVPKDEP